MKKNPDYISIGKVSKEKNVTIKALRYYDSIGVFKPAYVDKVTNYRYYDKSKLYILDAILLCVELGMPLKKFEKYKNADDQFDLRQLLYDGKSLGEQKIADIRKRLGTLSKTIARIEGDATVDIPEETVSVKKESDSKKADLKATEHVEKKVAEEIVASEALNTSSGSSDIEKVVPNSIYTEKDVAAGTKETTTTTTATDEQIEETATNRENARIWNKKNLAQRGILTAPLEGGAADSKKILRLNMVAQLLGMTASYPAGRLYEYDESGKATAYAYILVEGYESCEDKRLKLLPEGLYYCLRGERQEEPEIVVAASDVIKSYRNVTIIETDIVGSEDVEIQIIAQQ